ncbi:hypothetical protein C8Q77DRAFT_1213602 [Trametes polyzona]|nr:hypothetical protein C8Q77DRAFT_1213602 [Trametes polyzona]
MPHSFPKVIHDGAHFNLRVKYDPITHETTRTWVWEQDKVWNADWHLANPKPKTDGEKYPILPSSASVNSSLFAPVAGSSPMVKALGPERTPEIGTRYCQHIHAIVPEHLPYKIGKLAPAQKPLRERILTREFWHLPFAGEDSEEGEADASVNSAGIEIKIVPASDGTTVLAEGLTYHQAALIPIRDAQKDMAIRYRSLTTKRADLMQPAAAQQVKSIKYRTAIGH